MPPDTLSPVHAAALDAADPLACYRQHFAIDDPNLIYLDGNSLGRLPLDTAADLSLAMRDAWGRRLVRGWGEGWLDAPRRLGDRIGALLGAAPGQVIVTDSTSVNLYKLAMTALRLCPDRTKVISDTANFPSDLYILQGCIESLGGRELVRCPAPALENGWSPAALLDAIDAGAALVTLSHVHFKSGYCYDAAEITRRAHQRGALVLWDLSHSAGAVPVALDDWDADFAVGCTYKYLNGGPGAPAFLYVHRRWLDDPRARSPLWGWFGQQSPFAFDLDYAPAPGIERFLCGTPPVLALLAIERGVELLLEAGMDALREKSLQQTGYLLDLFDRLLAPRGFSLGTPRDPGQRGSHVAIRHPEGYRITRALVDEMAVIPDFREPDNIRLGITPLYTTYAEIWEAVDRIARVVDERRYERYPLQRQAVT